MVKYELFAIRERQFLFEFFARSALVASRAFSLLRLGIGTNAHRKSVRSGALMVLKAKQSMYLGFLLTGILVIISGAISRLAHIQGERTQDDISQTHKLVKDLDRLEFTSLEVTMLLRAFVISGDIRSMDELPALRSRIGFLRSRIEAEVREDSGLTAHYHQFLNYADQRKEFVNKVIDARKREGFSAAKAMEATSEDDRLFTCMEREMNAMLDVVLSRLAAQEASNQVLQKRIVSEEWTTIILTLLLLIAMGIKLATVVAANTRLLADLIHRSEFDLLTDIPNRRQLEQQLNMLLEKAAIDGSIFALIFIDLDRFKQINDSHGHRVGDLFLQHAARRMKHQLRPGDLLARLGGDEFAVLLASVPDRKLSLDIAHRLERSFDSLFDIGNLQIQGSASMGIALYPDDGNDAEALLHSADMAMYAVKQSHKGSFTQRRDYGSGIARSAEKRISDT